MKKIIMGAALLCMFLNLKAQEPVVVSPGASFLMVNPDVRAAGMGDAGGMINPGVWSMYWNPAAYALLDSKGGVGLSYTPWMRNFADGQNLYALAGYYRINKKSVVALTGRFFSAGDYPLVTLDGENGGTTPASDFAIDVAYARQFGKFSVAAGMRFIHSGIKNADFISENQDRYRWTFDAANAWALDLGVMYADKLSLGGCDGSWKVGLAFTNLGSKMKNNMKLVYEQDGQEGVFSPERKDYLPAMMRLSSGVDLPFCDRHGVSIAVDFARLLVESTTEGIKDNSVLSNVFGSFSNKAFLKSVIWSVGAEYNWKKMVMGRAGYFHESETYGNRQYFTLGAGGFYRQVNLDVSYLLPTNDSDSPLKNTWRVGVGYTF